MDNVRGPKVQMHILYLLQNLLSLGKALVHKMQVKFNFIKNFPSVFNSFSKLFLI